MKITCTANNNLLFYQTIAITIAGVQFNNCGPGEPLPGIPVRPSSLYFHACRDIHVSDVYVVHSAGRGITFYNTMGNNNLSLMVALCNGTGVTFEFTGSPVMDPASDPAYERALYFIYGISNREDVSSGAVFCNATTFPTKSNPFEGFGGGLSIIFCGNARRNSISFLSMFATLFNRTAISGGGVFIGHFDHSSENAVQFEPNNLGNLSYSLSHNYGSHRYQCIHNNCK